MSGRAGREAPSDYSVVFIGTPAFAVPALESLVSAGFTIQTVVTQPDRPVGRSKTLQPPPIKAAAERLGLSVWQPESLRRASALEYLEALAPDVIVVVAYGQILRRRVLDSPRFGCINVHPSLLPKLRGATPIPSAILEGAVETGVTIMLMDERMDSGPVLAQRGEPVLPRDTTAALSARLATAGAGLLVATLLAWLSGTIAPRLQSDADATYTRPIEKANGQIDWSKSALEIDRQCRAYDPWPGCFSTWNGESIRFWQVEALADDLGEPPGTVVLIPTSPRDPSALAITTGSGALRIDVLQRAGRRAVRADEFLRGQPGFVGSRLESAGRPPSP